MTSIKTGPSRLGMHLVAIPAAVTIIVFLGYSSQYLFNSSSSYLDPGPLSLTESIVFNSLLACLWWTYFRACTVDPGRYVFPPSQQLAKPIDRRRPASSSSSSSSSSGSSSHSPTAGAAAANAAGGPSAAGARWCKKCNAPKPDRAHHCRHCRRCIPKMDHHCPWTGNCVSMQTFPHFLRFVVFTNLSLWALAALLARRFYALYDQRHLPAYLGPSLPQLIHLTMLALVCSATLLALSIMLYTAVQSWLFNTTMIEGWEIERHEAVIDRYSSTSADGTWWDDDMEDDIGGDDDGYEEEDAALADEIHDDDDDEYYRKMEKTVRRAAAKRMRVEFPYDLGFFQNMAQAMGTANFLLWFLPFAGNPVVAPGGSGPGWDWPENGFNDREGMWPPPDPEKLRHAAAGGIEADSTAAFTTGWSGSGTVEEEKAAFQARQEADFRRRGNFKQAPAFSGATAPDGQAGSDDDDDDEFEQGLDGEPGWMNADGNRLRDYGVDEDAEDDDIPIAALLKRRHGAQGKKQQ